MKVPAVVRIARWELTAGAGGIDRQTLVTAIGLLVILGVVGPVVATSAAPPDAGIYRVGVDSSSAVYPAVDQSPKFVIQSPNRAAFNAGELDLLITETGIQAPETQKGRAAAAAYKAAVERYNTQLMRTEPDQAAAFPVAVQVRYVERDIAFVVDPGRAEADPGGNEPADHETSRGTLTPERDSSTTDDSGTEPVETATDGGPSIPGGGSSLLLGETSGSPADISPPFPFVSLVLAFAFVVPMNFVIQAYASSVLRERTNRRGELLLVTPVSRWSIITGKSLPYFLVMVAIAAATAAFIGGGLISLAAIIPIALLFLACAFVGAMLARSHKELTFVLVTISVVVTTYVFVPAIFTQVHPIAAISPLTLVVRDLQGTAVAAGTFVFSTAPMFLAAGVLFVLGAGLYRAEDLFAQRPIPAKLLDALASPIRGRLSAVVLSLVAIPFVFLAELLAVAVLFILPLQVGLPILLVVIAAIEEAAKSLHVYAGFERHCYARSIPTALVVGGLSGLGFFVGEKSVAIAQIVGLPELDLGRVAFELGPGLGGASGLILLGIFLLPLALHTVTAIISSLGASRDARWYMGAYLAAVLVHAGYNLGVVVYLG